MFPSAASCVAPAVPSREPAHGEEGDVLGVKRSELPYARVAAEDVRCHQAASAAAEPDLASPSRRCTMDLRQGNRRAAKLYACRL